MYFFDNPISPRLVNILRELDVEAQHLTERFSPSERDITWIRHAGNEGWVVVTLDHAIRHNEAERTALRQNRVRAIFLPKTFSKLGIWGQAEWLLRHWQKIDQQVQQLPLGAVADVSHRGMLSR
ncbi:MAG TPA: DUF5615 family PIN-like protein [Chthonomonas sp.]|uniref:DUF5615 family PIN-like protein n=1 Tax=Chthonomonas sp. TaxID=2282153 RepID=UPI002B4B3B59|nr:DUF5615 family PIN-like protein [Chthonomonas sp.]HLI48469.1 DUF5615 family PIN-like protein [Chthonomonas sp.]